MKSKALKIICVGKLKQTFCRDACDHYLRLAGKWRAVECVEVRDGGADPATRMAAEARNILAQTGPRDLLVALHEEGRQFTSPQFAAFLQKMDESEQRRLAFIVGGPFGLEPQLLARCAMRISLSAMTWPHELARALLLEQIFRAECILRNSPYHH